MKTSIITLRLQRGVICQIEIRILHVFNRVPEEFMIDQREKKANLKVLFDNGKKEILF